MHYYFDRFFLFMLRPFATDIFDQYVFSSLIWGQSYGSWIYNYLCNQCYYHHWCLWVRISMRARCTTLCDKVCQWLATGWWVSPGPPVSSTNKTDRHDINEILLKVALNTIKQTNFKICKIYLLKVEHTFPTRLDYMSNMASVL